MGAETLCYLSLHDLSGRIRRGDVSPVEAVEAFLQRIEQLNPLLSAFLTLCADRALEESKRAGAEFAAGRWRGPLHGVPYGIKDIIETAGDAKLAVRLNDGTALNLGPNARFPVDQFTFDRVGSAAAAAVIAIPPIL